MTINDSSIYALIQYYIKLYEDKYNLKANINKHKEKWAMKSLIEDFGADEVKKTLDYYFICTKDKHPLNWFFNNYDTLSESMNANERDKKLREERRLETMRIRQEYINGIS